VTGGCPHSRDTCARIDKQRAHRAFCSNPVRSHVAIFRCDTPALRRSTASFAERLHADIHLTLSSAKVIYDQQLLNWRRAEKD
jgi:hypothetical protein